MLPEAALKPRPRYEADRRLRAKYAAAPDNENTITSTAPRNDSARADSSGNVLDAVGTIDGETLAATVAMCAAPLERATDLTGLGSVTGWFLASKKAGYFVHREPTGFVVAHSGVAKNPEGTMKKLAAALDAKS